ncbi:uncharacterized protein LOC143192711 isoform X2 [Rhynchophorus ferrugineus]|uniref:uncharacterized protein LOC143192711 isoform X2 n=1 Tax=Rhynchophorus ferrugineus TaxID=354439 RepID=UPI003FCEE0D0
MLFRPSAKIFFVFATIILLIFLVKLLKFNSDGFSSVRSFSYNQTRNVSHTHKNLKIDNETKYSEQEILEQVQHKLPNLPVKFWNQNIHKTLRINASCAIFPNILDMRYSNSYWQIFESVDRTYFHLYGAYLDNRPKNIEGPVVRILGLINSRNPSPNTHCQLWFENRNQPIIVKVKEYKYIWYKEWNLPNIDRYEPYLITCELPKAFLNATPSSVSIVNKPCDIATNNLRVIYNPSAKQKEFAVCVKGLDFSEDLSVRVVEWLELVKLLGADKVFFYELNIHKNTSKVLQYYQQLGQVEVTPMTTAGYTPNEPLLRRYFLKNRVFSKRHNELIPYNDCFYRHMYEYKYIILLDIDEVIMPISTQNWTSLLQKIVSESMKENKKKPSHYHSQNTFFLDSFLDESKSGYTILYAFATTRI